MTSDHGQPPITTRVAFTSLYNKTVIGLFTSINQCIHHSTLLKVA